MPVDANGELVMRFSQLLWMADNTRDLPQITACLIQLCHSGVDVGIRDIGNGSCFIQILLAGEVFTMQPADALISIALAD